MAEKEAYFVGVDVGTGSVRAMLVSETGRTVATATHALDTWEPETDFYEQSSDDIWNACCKTVKMVTSDVDKDCIRGIGFDATCSLVALDKQCQPISVSPSDGSGHHWNVILWMDHRAVSQTQKINATGHSVLACLGGHMSLEMQMPKLLWLKENKTAECWNKAGHFFDLPDFLTWRATGSFSRSLCSLVCKWTYQADEGKREWDESFFRELGLDELLLDNCSKIGHDVRVPGEPCGNGLTEEAARELGLNVGTAVATSLIDAHSGGIGSVGSIPVDDAALSSIPLASRMALICGTSTCHMAVSDKPVFVPGVWGPFFSAMIPGLFLSEGGQSATGKLIEHVVTNHPAYSWVKEDAIRRSIHPYSILNEILADLSKTEAVMSVSELTAGLHMWPDFHGNRSPLSHLTLSGMICGLTLSVGVEDLAKKYLATVQALAYGTRHIIEAMQTAGHDIRVIFACGGLSKNEIFIQTHADVTGIPIVVPNSSESVLLGAAILGACASKHFKSIQEAMVAMTGSGEVIRPQKDTQDYHRRKYNVFLKMVEHQQEYDQVMKG